MQNCAVTETRTRWEVLTVWHRKKDNNWDGVGRSCLFTLAQQIVVDSLTALPTIFEAMLYCVYSISATLLARILVNIYSIFILYIFTSCLNWCSWAHRLWIRGASVCVSQIPLETGIKDAGLYGLLCWITKIQYGFFVLLKHRSPLGSLVACVWLWNKAWVQITKASQRQTVVNFPPGWGSPQITQQQWREMATVQHLQDARHTPSTSQSPHKRCLKKPIDFKITIIVGRYSALSCSITSLSTQFQGWLQQSKSRIL